MDNRRLLFGGIARATRGAAVGARKRLSVGHKHLLEGGGERARSCSGMGESERCTIRRGSVRIVKIEDEMT